MTSNLKLYALAKVIKDKEPDESKIVVVPYELLTDLTKTITGASRDVNVDVKDLDANTGGTISVGTSLEATEWLSSGGNRTTPEDVVLGEDVFLWKYEGDPTVYWQARNWDGVLRKREHVVHLYANTGEDLDESNTKEKAYKVVVSTRDKVISITTTDNDKEASTYECSLNTKDGLFTFKDSHDNVINLNSVDRYLTVKTGTVLVDAAKTRITGTLTVDRATVLKATLNVLGLSTLASLVVKGSSSLASTVISAGLKVAGTVAAGLFKGPRA